VTTEVPVWNDRFEQLLRGYLPYLSPDEPLVADLELRDYGLDSLASVELLSAIEAEFGVRIADDDLSLDTFQTPTVLWQAVSTVLPSGA
jgi:acyl carrier protein